MAQRKVSGLLRCGANVTVVSPKLTAALERAAETRGIRHRARRFRPSDLRGAWLVIAATDDEAVNEQVSRAAAKARIFCNVVDRKTLCSFIAPAILRRGPVTIAISTGGSSPMMAKRLRREIAAMTGAEYARMTRLLGGLREIVKQRLPAYDDRRQFFQRLVDGPVFELVRAGRLATAKHRALQLLKEELALLHRAN